MAEQLAKTVRQRPGPMGLKDAFGYKLPPAGVVSILHRVSGGMMFVLLPFVIWMFDASVTSQISYDGFMTAFRVGVPVGSALIPGLLFKLVALALIWGYLHHFIAGVRHLYMDATHSVSKEFGRSSALFTLGLSLVLTAALGYKLFF